MSLSSWAMAASGFGREAQNETKQFLKFLQSLPFELFEYLSFPECVELEFCWNSVGIAENETKQFLNFLNFLKFLNLLTTCRFSPNAWAGILLELSWNSVGLVLQGRRNTELFEPFDYR